MMGYVTTLVLACVLSTGLAGCEPRQDPAAASRPTTRATQRQKVIHSATGRPPKRIPGQPLPHHGGSFYRLAKGKGYLELVLDADKGELWGYIWNANKTRPMAAEQGYIELQVAPIRDRQGERVGGSFGMTLRPAKLSNWPSSSQYATAFSESAPELRGLAAFFAVVGELRVGGEVSQGRELTYPADEGDEDELGDDG